MSGKRKPLSKMVRFEVFKRDRFTCAYCGLTPPEVILEVDHVIAVAEGGGNDIDNLVTACRPCNAGKSARSLTAVPQSLAERAEEVSEREEQVRAFADVMAKAKERIEDDAWSVADPFARHFGQVDDDDVAWVAQDQFRSICRFVELLPASDVLKAMETALHVMRWRRNSTVFRYFCGICWKKIKGEQSGAL